MPALEARLDDTGDAERGNSDRLTGDATGDERCPGSRRRGGSRPRARQRMLSPVGRAPVPFVAWGLACGRRSERLKIRS
jgi:hypothetical protein